jgi:hypothetical protein
MWLPDERLSKHPVVSLLQNNNKEMKINIHNSNKKGKQSATYRFQ